MGENKKINKQKIIIMKIYERDSKGNILKFENENERFWYKFWRSKFTWGCILIALVISPFVPKDKKEKATVDKVKNRTETSAPTENRDKSTTSSFWETQRNEYQEETETSVKEETIEKEEISEENSEPGFHFEPIEQEKPEINNEEVTPQDLS